MFLRPHGVHKAGRGRDRCASITAMINGDTTIARCMHYENGCCTNEEGQFDRDVCVRNFVAACQNGAVLCDEPSDLPTKNRWGSLQEHEAEHVLEDFIHKLHTRACVVPFKSFDRGADNLDDESEDYRAMVRGKAYRTVLKVTDSEYQYQKACRNFCMASTQHLWMRLQHMDEVGNSVFDLNFPPCNPIAESRETTAVLLFRPIMDGPMKTPFQQYQHEQEHYDGMIEYTRRISLSIDAQVCI